MLWQFDQSNVFVYAYTIAKSQFMFHLLSLYVICHLGGGAVGLTHAIGMDIARGSRHANDPLPDRENHHTEKIFEIDHENPGLTPHPSFKILATRCLCAGRTSAFMAKSPFTVICYHLQYLTPGCLMSIAHHLYLLLG
jgi:hypothetical protein